MSQTARGQSAQAQTNAAGPVLQQCPGHEQQAMSQFMICLHNKEQAGAKAAADQALRGRGRAGPQGSCPPHIFGTESVGPTCQPMSTQQ